MRILGRVLIGLAVIYVLLVAALAAAMRQPPATFGQIVARAPWPLFVVLPAR